MITFTYLISYVQSVHFNFSFVYDQKMGTSRSSARNSQLTQGGTNDNDDHALITSQCKIKLWQKYCLWINKFTTWNFCQAFLQWLLWFALQYVFLQIGSQTWASLSFVPPGWGANSSQNCRSCSFSGHKQRCWTVLSELRYNIAYNPNTFFLNWEQRTAGKAVEHALQYIKMYVVGVWTKTAKGHFKNVEEQVIRRHSKVWSNL